MAAIPRPYAHPIEPAQTVAPEILRALPDSGQRSPSRSAKRAPLTVAKAGGSRAVLSDVCTTVAKDDGTPSARLRWVERRGQRATACALEAEFNALYRAHFRLVWRALYRFGVRDSDLMDLTQKVFLTAYLKMPQFEGRSLISTWLWEICRRSASAYRRSRAIRCEIATDPTNLHVSIDQSADTTSELEPERRLMAEHLLSKLTEQQRVVLTLFEVVELDGAEIGALLDVSIDTVRSRLRYARKKCRRELRRLERVSSFSQPARP